MIAYRAETAMAQILRQNMTRHDDARSLLRAIYSTEVDIVPDPQANTLTIRLHPLANTSSDLAVRHLCAELNTTETQPPEAGAEGQSLQGTITRPRSVTQSDDRVCSCRDAQRGRKMSMPGGQYL
jgi:hypothetical protein